MPMSIQFTGRDVDLDELVWRRGAFITSERVEVRPADREDRAADDSARRSRTELTRRRAADP